MTIRLLSRWLAWLLVLAIAVFTLAPIEFRPVTAAPADWERFAAFTAMGSLFCLGYPRHRFRIICFVIGAAGLLEVLQHLNPTRHGRLPDGAVKVVGALWGVVLVVLAERIFDRLRTGSRPGRDPRATIRAQRTNRPPASGGIKVRAGLSDTSLMASEKAAKGQNQPHAQ